MKTNVPLMLQHLVPLLLFLSIEVFQLNAQSSTLNIQKFSVNGFNFNLNANVVYQDKIGYLWIGTNNGLYRYDGQDLKEFQYDVFDPKSLPNNTINSVLEDDNGNLWIGTESYLVFYNRLESSFQGFYKNTTAKILGKTNDGIIWANLWKTGFVKITPGKDADSFSFDTSHNYQRTNSLLLGDKKVNSLYEDVHGRVWLATNRGILAVNNASNLIKTKFTDKTLFLLPFRDSSFLAVTNRTIYVLAYSKGNRKLEILDQYLDNLPKPFLATAVAYNSDKSEYTIATKKGLLKVKFDYKDALSFSYTFKNNSLDHSLVINSLTFDHHRNLWIANTNGMFKIANRGDIFESFSVNENENKVSALYKGSKDNIYVGTTTGEVFGINKGKAKLLINENNRITRIIPGYTLEETLVAVNTTLKKSTNLESGKPIVLETIKKYKKIIKDVLPVNQNEIWVGLWSGGIDIINNAAPLSQFKKKLIQDLDGLNVSALHLDQNNGLWIGTRGQGIYLIDLINEKLSHIYPDNPSGLNSNAILCFLEHNGKMYIGTRGGGINVSDLKAQRFKVYTKEEGLNSLTIASMEVDSKGNIWAGTMHGITLFNPNTESFTNFGSSDGLTENQFVFNTDMKDDSGNIYFTNRKTITKIKPNEYSKNEQLANTLITDFKILGTRNDNNEWVSLTSKPINLEGKVLLPYDKYSLSIKFTSLDFTAPEKNKFAYKMEGVNDYWVHTTAGNSLASYNGLASGTYIFKVKSTNSDGVWNEQLASIVFEIALPFWQTPTAIIIYILLIASVIYGATVLIRKWYLMKKNLVAETVSRQKDNEHHQMKMIFFTDISHELRTPLTLIQGTIEKVVREGRYQLKEKTARRIYNNSLRIGRLIDQIMDIRKNDVNAFRLKVSQADIIKDTLNIKNAFNDFAQIHDISYQFKCKEKQLYAYYDLQILEKVLFNLLSNAFKYTPEKGNVVVSLRTIKINTGQSNDNELKTGRYVKCSVWDNGIGILADSLPFIFDRYYQSTKIPAHKIPG
ncbi:MAG: two-component regulator propeller domain-containing protein, partial [Bacteroidota bacterium]